MSKTLRVNIKMYRVGELGDCFLLRFNEGESQSHVLIDCGSFRNGNSSKARLRTVVSDIKKQLDGGALDVVVGTHQHNDHLSGFVHCKDLFSESIKQVWLSWLDNPKDAFARRISRDQKNLVVKLKGIQQNIKKLGLSKNYPVVNDVIDFFGASGDDAPFIPAQGVEILKGIGENEVQYLSPGDTLTLPGLPENAVKVYVLGPPRNRKQLFDTTPGKEETYDLGLSIADSSASKILSALKNMVDSGSDPDEEQFPFDNSLKRTDKKIDPLIKKIYANQNEAWRKIDNEWLEAANRLALYLDSYTNNSSLVLAFELVKTGKVLLFAADAQTGNWLSWEKIKWTGCKPGFHVNQLLENTVLYKVGHHGSHNATLVNGLEAMNHPELVAMIPVDKSDANITKKNGWKMPAKNLFKRLREKTNYRVLRMDDGFAEGCDPKKNKAKAKWKDVKFLPNVKPELYVEYTVQG
jgi:glyoxylase-like metal-dependent hydrolase (beta-lactamase superfamily II)